MTVLLVLASLVRVRAAALGVAPRIATLEMPLRPPHALRATSTALCAPPSPPPAAPAPTLAPTRRKRLLALALKLQSLSPRATSAAVDEVMSSEPPLSSHNLTSLLLTLKQRHKWRQAALLLTHARSAGVEIRPIHYNLAISAANRGAPRSSSQQSSQQCL